MKTAHHFNYLQGKKNFNIIQQLKNEDKVTMFREVISSHQTQELFFVTTSE
jgi:hypothetical protein